MKTTNKLPRMRLGGAKYQQGIVLISAVMFLVIVTLVAVASMRGTVLQERVTGSMRNRSMAANNADIGMRVAEMVVQENYDSARYTPCMSGVPTILGLCDDYSGSTAAERNSRASTWKTFDWSRAARVGQEVTNGLLKTTPIVASNLPGTDPNALPQYYIQVEEAGNVPGGKAIAYALTVQASGQNADAEVLRQEILNIDIVGKKGY